MLISIMPAGSLPLVAGDKTGARNLADFVSCARAGKVNVGTYAAGSYAHIAIAELNKQYGLRMEPVRRGAGRAAGRPRPGDRGVAQAHERDARRADLHGAGGDVAGVPPDRLPVLRRARRHDARDRQADIAAPGRSRQRPEGAGHDAALRHRRGRDDAGGDQKLYADEAPIWLDLDKSLRLEPM